VVESSALNEAAQHFLRAEGGQGAIPDEMYKNRGGVLRRPSEHAERDLRKLKQASAAEDDGELGLGLEPLARRPFPFVSRVVQNQV
jgi:hypothetical protein